MSVTHRVLFVCEANVCRSALMEAVFLASMPADRWRAHSAGTAVRGGDRAMCDISAEVAGCDPLSHSSVQLTREGIERNHLVVTASRAVRAEVAALAPGMRWKIFTLRELNFLAARAPAWEGGLAVADGSRHVDDLERYAIVLHRRRGLEQSPGPRRWRFGRKARSHSFDIDDVHGSKLSVHRSALEAVVEDVRELSMRLSEAVPGRSS